LSSLAVAWQASRYGDLPELAWHTYGSGHLHGLSAPGLGLELALEPDALHRETQRRLSSADQPQPLILERGYTALGQLDHLSLRGPGSAKGEQHYRYDALGRLSFRSQGSVSPAIAYSYDAAGRLIASQHGDRAHRYPVDAAGNRLEGQASAQPDNRLTQLDGTRYRHDGAGNLIERETSNGERLSLGYDGANRLVRLTRTSAQGATEEARYRYDALGRRICKTVHHANGTTATTHYGWDGDRLVHEAKERHQTTVVYEPGSFVPMLRIDQAGNGAAKQISAFVTDALGTPMQLVTPRGDTLWQAQPDDWAAVTNEQGRTDQPIRFQGQWYDEESGLYYNRHRYYDPQQGRYINQDPIGLNGGTNLYGYVANPTAMVDPLGLNGWRSDHAWRDQTTNNGIIRECVRRVGEWIDMPDYSGVADTRNSIMAAINRYPGAALATRVFESAAIHNVCSSRNNRGVPDGPGFTVWPDPVPQEIKEMRNRQADIPSSPGSVLRRAADEGIRPVNTPSAEPRLR